MNQASAGMADAAAAIAPTKAVKTASGPVSAAADAPADRAMNQVFEGIAFTIDSGNSLTPFQDLTSAHSSRKNKATLRL